MNKKNYGKQNGKKKLTTKNGKKNPTQAHLT
jgi:hypothetical protein